MLRPMSPTGRARGASCVAALAMAAGLSACGSSTSKPTVAATTAAATPPPSATTPATGATSAAHATVTLNTTRVAAAITNSILTERNIKATVVCPADVPQEQGHSFTCVATTSSTVNGKKVPVHTDFTVQQTNNLGNVTYASPQ